MGSQGSDGLQVTGPAAQGLCAHMTSPGTHPCRGSVLLQQVQAWLRCQQLGHGAAPTCRSGAASSSAKGHTVSSSLTTILLATSRDTFCRAPAAEPHTAQLCDLQVQGAEPS